MFCGFIGEIFYGLALTTATFPRRNHRGKVKPIVKAAKHYSLIDLFIIDQNWVARKENLCEICSMTFSRLLVVLAVAFVLGYLFYDSRRPNIWMDDYEAALGAAKTKNTPLLIYFTDSDAKGACAKLQTEVFSTFDFKEYAQKDLVLLKADFPSCHGLPARISRQNEQLKKLCNVDVLPAVAILDSTGKIQGLLGYMPGGVFPYLNEIKRLMYQQ